MQRLLSKRLIRTTRERAFGWIRLPGPGWGAGDAVALLVVTVFLYAGIRLAFRAPSIIQASQLSLSRAVLPVYAALSLLRMLVAYALSVIFSLVYGQLAARNRRAEPFLIPLLDVLQSVPILSFLPVVLLSFSAVLPAAVAAEAASIVLIFTSQAWNLTFAWYQSLKTIPKELREAAATFRFSALAAIQDAGAALCGTMPLIWNSMMSWAGGWFFLMAAEIFTVGSRDFRLPGLGAYLQAAANRVICKPMIWGLVTLVGDRAARSTRLAALAGVV